MVVVDEAFASRIKIHRRSDGAGGFQRQLSGQRLNEISKYMLNGGFCPPIIVASINGELILIDGQHRLEAWRLKHYRLMATVVEVANEAEAANAFVKINAEAKRVSLQHVLSVSTEEYATKIRALAEKYKVNISFAHNLLGGIANKPNPIKFPLTSHHWHLAEKVLSTWTKQKRWGQPGNVFTTAGIMRLVGFFVSKASNADSMLKDMLTFDYSKSGSLGRMAGTSYGAQMSMRQFVYENLAKKVL